MIASTGNEIEISGNWLLFSGKLETMDRIPDAELDAFCAAEGKRRTGRVIDETTEEVVDA